MHTRVFGLDVNSMNHTYAYSRVDCKIKFRMVSVQHFINEAPVLALICSQTLCVIFFCQSTTSQLLPLPSSVWPSWPWAVSASWGLLGKAETTCWDQLACSLLLQVSTMLNWIYLLQIFFCILCNLTGTMLLRMRELSLLARYVYTHEEIVIVTEALLCHRMTATGQDTDNKRIINKYTNRQCTK